MLSLADIRIRSKMALLFILAGSIPLITAGLIASNLTSNNLIAKSLDQLITVQIIRKSQIEIFFSHSSANVRIQANSYRVDSEDISLDHAKLKQLYANAAQRSDQ